MTKVTICIITCRRPIGLKRLLDALDQQQISSDTEMDIIVVDNACDQTTTELVSKLHTKNKYKIRYFEEPEPGIVAARNKCVTEFLLSDSEFLLFIDDDEWPESNNWAQKMLDAQKKYSTDIIASHVISVGEPGTPIWATELLYGKNNFTEGQTLEIFYTGNLLLSKNILEVMQPAFDKRFALTGTSDFHFALKCKNAGFTAFYTNAPAIEEFPKSRAAISWFAKRGYRSGFGFTKSHLYEGSIIKVIPYCLMMSGVRFLRGVYNLSYGVLSINKLRFVEGIFRLSSFIGTLAGFFEFQYQEYKTIHGK